MSKNKNKPKYENKCPICHIVCTDRLMHVDGKEFPIHAYLCPTCSRMYANSVNHNYLEKMIVVSEGNKKFLYNLLSITGNDGLKTILINGKDEQVLFTKESKINVIPFHLDLKTCVSCDCDLQPIYLCPEGQKDNIPALFCEKCGIYYVDKEVINNNNCFNFSYFEVDMKLEEPYVIMDCDQPEEYRESIINAVDKYLALKNKCFIDKSKIKEEKGLFIEEIKRFNHRKNIYSAFEKFLNKIDLIIKENNEFIEKMNAKKEFAKKNKVELFIVNIDEARLKKCPCCSHSLSEEYNEMYDVDLDTLVDVRYKKCSNCNKKFIGINQQKEYNQLAKSILGLYVKNAIIEQPILQSSKVTVHVYKKAFGNKCIKRKHPEELVSMETVNLKTGVRKPMNVSHCMLCNKYWVENIELERFTSRMFKPIFNYEFDESFTVSEKSTMKLYGYTVGKTKGLPDAKRHDIIDMLLFHKLMTPSAMIGLLSNNVRKAEAKMNVDMSDAIREWNDDISYIRNDYPAKKTKLVGIIK